MSLSPYGGREIAEMTIHSSFPIRMPSILLSGSLIKSITHSINFRFAEIKGHKTSSLITLQNSFARVTFKKISAKAAIDSHKQCLKVK